MVVDHRFTMQYIHLPFLIYLTLQLNTNKFQVCLCNAQQYFHDSCYYNDADFKSYKCFGVELGRSHWLQIAQSEFETNYPGKEFVYVDRLYTMCQSTANALINSGAGTSLKDMTDKWEAAGSLSYNSVAVPVIFEWIVIVGMFASAFLVSLCKTSENPESAVFEGGEEESKNEI